MLKTETSGVYVMERSSAIEKVKEWNKDKKNLRIMSTTPFQRGDKGWDVTYCYDEGSLIDDCYCGCEAIIDDQHGYANSDVFFVKCKTCSNKQNGRYFSRQKAILEWNRKRDYYSEHNADDIKFTYKDENGSTRTRKYRTIMDFLEIMKNKFEFVDLKYCSCFNAIFFENQLNVKEVDTIDQLIRHCNMMLGRKN